MNYIYWQDVRVKRPTLPVCEIVLTESDLLWPPIHKLIPVEIMGLTDQDNDQVTITIENVIQDELDKALGDAGGRPDTVIKGKEPCCVRKEQEKDQILSVLDTVKGIGLDKFSMNMLMPQGAALEDIDEVLVTYTEIGRIVLEVYRYAEEMGLVFLWYSPTPICIFNPIIHGLGNKGCAACDGLLSIAPNGDILPCSSFPRPMGNILNMKGRFEEVWKGADFAFFQKKGFAHEICRNCQHLAICTNLKADVRIVQTSLDLACKLLKGCQP